jgi:hypothetical protein
MGWLCFFFRQKAGRSQNQLSGFLLHRFNRHASYWYQFWRIYNAAIADAS